MSESIVNKVHKKKRYQIIFLFPVFYLIFFMFMYIHEIGHFIVAIITKTEIYSIKIASDGTIGFYHSNNNLIKSAIISMGGICSTSIILYPLLIIAIKRRSLVFSIPILSYLFFELLYFGLSPIIQLGDSFNLCNYLHIPVILRIFIIIIPSFAGCFIQLYFLCVLLRRDIKVYIYFEEVIYAYE